MSHLISLIRKIPKLGRDIRTTVSGDGTAAVLDYEGPTEQAVVRKTKTPSPFRTLQKRGQRKRETSIKQALTTGLSSEGAGTPDLSLLEQIQIPKKITTNTRGSKSTPQFSATDCLSIPCPDPTGEERIRDSHQNRALNLVRQEDWSSLSKLIKAADHDRSMTPGGMCVVDLLAYGARADVVAAAEHALIEQDPEEDAPLMCGIEALEFVLAESADDYIIGCIVAQAHMDMAWAWRGIGWDVEIAPRNREAFAAHFARARDIMAAFPDAPTTSLLYCSTVCALLGGAEFNIRSIADNYASLIDLNPANSGPMRALGTQMLPRATQSFADLELEARRTAVRTRATWGAGGYTWVMFDAISINDEACARLDLPFFIEGLRDILDHRPEPHTVNLLAAYCANMTGQVFSGNDAADHIRAQIAACANWIVRDYLTELHPMIWAHAAQGFVNNLRVASANRFARAGHDDALRLIGDLFKHEIAQGKRITFTENGPIAKAG